MSTEIFHQSLSGTLFPKSWLKKTDLDATQDIPFILDVLPIGDHLHVYISARVAQSEILDRLEFFDGNQSLKLSGQRAVPRGVVLMLDCANAHQVKALKIRFEGQNLKLDIAPNLLPYFEDLNTVYMIEVDPDPETFKDWLKYHCSAQNVEAVVMLRRCEKNKRRKEVAKKLLAVAGAQKGLKTFALLDCELPLGNPKEPSVKDRWTTPDGPGKALLDPAQPAPYASTLFELSVMDACRRRCFDRARAVVNISQSDLLTCNDAGLCIFDAAVASDTYIKFTGKLAYPFGYNSPKQPKIADHTCMSFDGKRAPYAWAISRKFMDSDPALRSFRASQAEPDPVGQSFNYWRLVGVRYPDLKIGQIVPKASLVENVDLCALIHKTFNYTPKHAPTISDQHKDSAQNDKILIVTTMKNEGPFMLEWLAYHMSIGVTDFVVYTNDCTDGTDTMFDILDRKGIVEHRENPYRETGQKPQHAAYHAAQETQKARDADWIICMDVDEYINVHVGDGTLHDLFAAVPDASVWSLTWRLFGNAEVDVFEDKFITEQFFRCAPHVCRKPHQAWGFKTLFRNNGHYKKFGVHRPVGLKPQFKDRIHWVNGSGAKMPEDILRTGWRNTAKSYGYDLVTLNHYALRSCESFLVKRDRGRVNHVDRDQGMAYWFRMNNNAEHDTSVLNKIPRAKEIYQELLSDPEIAAQHHASVAAHRKRIGELKERPDYMAMYETLKSERMVKLSRLHVHFGSAIFLEGPESIPLDFPLIDEVEL